MRGAPLPAPAGRWALLSCRGQSGELLIKWPMAVTFELPGCEVVEELLPRMSAAEAVHRSSSRGTERFEEDETGEYRRVLSYPPMPRFEAVSELPNGVVESVDSMHPFASCIASAYSMHLPLRLSPDDVWLVLAQGFATHIRLHAEQLRERFVEHEGKVTLQVQRHDFERGAEDNPWPECFEAFADQLHAHLGKRAELVLADFSTTGALERTVSQLVLMDAMQSYFEYEFITLCGVPRVTLTGEVADWRSVLTRARVLREYELGWWVDALEPILAHFVAAAEGRVDEQHWAAIYKLHEDSGGPYQSGWFHVLFPYLRAGDDSLQRNHYLKNWAGGSSESFGAGPTSTELPGGLSRVPMRWIYLGEELDMELLGGFIGVDQDPETFELSPQLGWAVRERGG